MTLKEKFEDIDTRKKGMATIDTLDTEKYNEYMEAFNNFQLDLDDLMSNVTETEKQAELETFYNDCLEKEELEEFIESYRKEVWEKYSKYVIEHLDSENEAEKTNTNQIVRLTKELVAQLLIKTEWQAELELNWLEVLDEDSAKALIEYKWQCIHLDWLKELSSEVAVALSWFDGNEISLNWLSSFTEWAVSLKWFKWEKLYLKWITTLTKEDIEKIKGFEVKSINFGEIEDEEIKELLSKIDWKKIKIWEWEDGNEWDESKEWEDGTGKKILDWIEKQCDKVKAWWKDKFKPWLNDRAWVKAIKEELDKEDITFWEWLRKKIIK